MHRPCKRCDGAGRLPHFGHIHNGVCLSCRGAGQVRIMRVIREPYAFWNIADDLGNVLSRDNEKEAEALAQAWRAMGLITTITQRQGVRSKKVPA